VPLPPDAYTSVFSVLKAAFPGAKDSVLERHASRIVIDRVLTNTDPMVGRRGTKPAIDSLNKIHRRAAKLINAIKEMGPDERFVLGRMP
jgi:hypothetical protein